MLPKRELFDVLEDLINQGVEGDQLESKIKEEFERVCTVAISDSCGFTRVTKAKGILYYLTCIVKMRKIAKETLESNGATYFRFEADNLYATFENPNQALKAMSALNLKLKEAKIILTDDENYRICTGIGHGKMYLSSHEGTYGDEMNLASKLGEDTAEGEEILMTEKAYELLDQSNKSGFEQRHLDMAGVKCPYYLKDLSK